MTSSGPDGAQTPAIQRIRRAAPLIVLVLTVIAGLSLRLHTMGIRELTYDEALTRYFALLPWGDLWRDAPVYDVHPPLYYATAKAFGAAELFSLRLSSLIFGLLTILAGYAAARAAVGEGPARALVGVVAAILIAVAARQVGISQTARSYALFSLAMAISLTGLLRLFDGEPSRRRDYVAVAVLASGLALLLWTHNIGVIYAGVLGLSALTAFVFFHRKDTRRFWLIAAAGVGALVLWSPAIRYLVSQLQAVSGAFWIAPPSLFDVIRILNMNFGAPLPAGDAIVPMIAPLLANLGLMVLAIFGLRSLWRSGRRAAATILALTATIPVLVLLAYSYLLTPVFMLRVLYPTFLPWIIAIACGVDAFPLRWQKVAAGAFAAIVVGSGLGAQYSDRDEAWSDVAALIRNHSTGPAQVFAMPNSAALPLDFYVAKSSSAIIVTPLPAPFPAVDPDFVYGGGVLGIPSVDETTLRAIDAAIDQNPSAEFWMVVRNPAVYDPKGLLKSHFDRRFCLVRMEDRSNPFLRVVKLVDRRAVQGGDCALAAKSVGASISGRS